MATTTGTVTCIQIGDDFGFFTVKNSTTAATETLIIWFGSSDPSAFTRILQSMWVSLLRDAINTGSQVIAVHPNGGAIITSLELSKP